MEIHPFAASIPRMSEDERKELRESMKSHGYLHTHPVVTFEGKILDGRHRYEMACELEIKFDIVEYQGDDPGGYVLVTNVKGRRNLSPGQRAMAAQGVLEVEEKRAVERKVKAGKMFGRGQEKVGLDSGQAIPSPIITELIENAKEIVTVIAPIQEAKEMTQGRSAEITAKNAGVSRDAINKAKAIKTKSPELAKEVAEGKITLNAAYKEIKAKPVVEPKLEPVIKPVAEFSPTSRPKHAKQTHRELFSLHLAKLDGVVSPLQEIFPVEVLTKIADSEEELTNWIEQLRNLNNTLSRYYSATKKVNN